MSSLRRKNFLFKTEKEEKHIAICDKGFAGKNERHEKKTQKL